MGEMSAGFHSVVVEDSRIPRRARANMRGGWYPGLLIKEKREEWGFSQQELVDGINARLVEYLGMDPSFTLERLKAYEAGEQHISNKYVSELSVVLGIPLEQFFLGPSRDTAQSALAISQG